VDKKDTAIERMSRAMFTRIISSLTRTMQEEELSVAQVAALHLVDERGSMRIGDVVHKVQDMQHENSTAVGPPKENLVQLLLHRNIFGATIHLFCCTAKLLP